MFSQYWAKVSDNRTVGILNCRTIGPVDNRNLNYRGVGPSNSRTVRRTIGPLNCRTTEQSEYRTVGLWNRRTIEPLNHRTVKLSSVGESGYRTVVVSNYRNATHPLLQTRFTQSNDTATTGASYPIISSMFRYYYNVPVQLLNYNKTNIGFRKS